MLKYLGFKELFKTKQILGHPLICLNDAVNYLGNKRIHNTFQIRGEKTQRQQDSLKTNC